MADDNNNQNKNNQNPQSSPQKEPKKVIDVTKPKSEPQRSSIDASRVSAHTLREQQALEKLKKQVGTLDQHDNRMSKIKTIVAIILIIILIIIIIAFIIVIGRTNRTEEENYDIRVSMEIENKSLLSVITESGKEELRKINPGDKLAISAYARNANDYTGDVNTGSINPPNVFVRFRLKLILDYEDRYDILIPTMTDNWYKYNFEDESELANGVTEDDHFYYYCGSVPYQRRIELFSELEFSGDAITCDDGGKYGQIQVVVESIEADTNNLVNGIWPTAPQRWILDMVSGKYNTNN